MCIWAKSLSQMWFQSVLLSGSRYLYLYLSYTCCLSKGIYIVEDWVLCLLFLMQPSEENTYADIEAVYQCLETEYGISQEDIILYGQSVGSGPTLHLASRLPRLRGVVLHSAILSGLRVVCHVNFTFCFDIYKVNNSDWFSYLCLHFLFL